MATATQQSFACDCGALQGHVTAHGIKTGTRAVCFCADCRAAELYHGQSDPAPGPVDLFQMSPEDVVITKGAEHLRLMRLSPKGLMRWYAGCCGTPFANTLAKPTLPFAGLRADLFADKDALGKIRARGFIPQPGKPSKTKGAAGMVLGIFKRMATSRLSGQWRQTPFFDIETGEPVSEPKILSKEERAKHY
ncbi:hypothetical protein EBB79_13600 [Parasedimentitalea marina]|uniref:CENP-V/GFA domain-containing protein n=1 Tax=Parasedimentitalea marina TaxID=2483033 RepID=A0A3T0N435_9RHOB|nr:DUF6151 family protein [Parasedimentitalea marina]AZV78803.1 hypothetical protein EBB79_13600 [Parasedimentitalea marina]